METKHEERRSVEKSDALRSPRSDVDVAFVLVAERGSLEWQSTLLVESIRRWCGRLSSAPIYVLSPHPDRRPAPSVRVELESMGATYIESVRDSDTSGYGLNRVVAAAHVERTTSHDILVVVDSDTLFLREPEALILAPDQDAAARPVDVIGICTTGPDDPRSAFWQELCRLEGVDVGSLPLTTTGVDRRQILACYNASLFAVRRNVGILQRAERLLLDSIDRGMRPQVDMSAFRPGAGTLSADAAAFRGTGQAILTIAMWAATRKVAELPKTYNVPLHMLDRMMVARFQNAVHARYHWLLGPSEPLDPLRGRSDTPLTTEQRTWLDDRMAARRIVE